MYYVVVNFLLVIILLELFYYRIVYIVYLEIFLIYVFDDVYVVGLVRWMIFF